MILIYCEFTQHANHLIRINVTMHPIPVPVQTSNAYIYIDEIAIKEHAFLTGRLGYHEDDQRLNTNNIPFRAYDKGCIMEKKLQMLSDYLSIKIHIFYMLVTLRVCSARMPILLNKRCSI